MRTFSLRGHVALVTGGSRGIGAAIVKMLGEAGCSVAVNYRERAAEAEALAKAIVGAGGKAVAIGLTRGYAARLVKDGITVNAVAPSLIETDMMKGQPQLVSRIPLGRFGQPEEVAKAVMLLIDNPYMTGQTIAMSGGMSFN